MDYRKFSGFPDLYPEDIPGTSQWFYGHHASCSAYEVPEYKGNYEGTRLYIFNINGKVYEPFRQEKNVYLNPPVYSRERESFGILRFDFNKESIQAFEYAPEPEKLSLLIELPMSRFDDLDNILMVKEPFTVIKYSDNLDVIHFLWPCERSYRLEGHESLHFIDGDILITSKWYEDPDYREEVIFRSAATGEVLERHAGYIIEMPNGEKWFMTD
ncbi:MAG TPA: hypothetical protein GX501_01620 [Clostridiaceae bacterium]|nr:hypothetical protein [Clostridiaceae bacterium]